MEIPDGLELRPSPIHGYGIFATREFSAGIMIGPFIGKEYKWKDFMKEYGRDYRYTYRCMRTHTIISAKHDRNWITFVNDGNKGFQEPIVNCVMKKKGLWTLRAICAGEELLLDYGRNYPWN